MQIIMPKLGLTMTQGTITEWLRATGDSVKAGEVLFCYESEKVSLDYEAPADGVLGEILAPDGIHLLPEINLALAVDTGRGLMTPVLRGADRLSLPAIQRGYGALIERALTGAALPDDFTDGTFTITNLGAWDVDGFTPIINPPQAAILGVGRIVEKAVARAGEVVARPMLTLSLSFDHRIVDGATAARFLQRVKQLVERPLALLLT